MSPEEALEIEMDLRLEHFRDSEAALAAALSEVRNAAQSLDAAEAARVT